MKVSDLMSRDVEVLSPAVSVAEASRRMAKRDAGAMPVTEDGHLVGMITDRDIVVRVLAANRNPAETEVREAMTPEVEWCFEDDDLNDVAVRMSEQKIRRLAVVNRDRCLVGIVSVGDLAREEAGTAMTTALHGAAQAGGPHSQTALAGDQPPVKGSG
jgi:CBS domain-containing protein